MFIRLKSLHCLNKFVDIWLNRHIVASSNDFADEFRINSALDIQSLAKFAKPFDRII
jgi:hypothetical protein